MMATEHRHGHGPRCCVAAPAGAEEARSAALVAFVNEHAVQHDPESVLAAVRDFCCSSPHDFHVCGSSRDQLSRVLDRVESRQWRAALQARLAGLHRCPAALFTISVNLFRSATDIQHNMPLWNVYGLDIDQPALGLFVGWPVHRRVRGAHRCAHGTRLHALRH